VRAFYSQLSSIESTGAKEWCVGTRYHPADLYRDMMEMVEIYYDKETDDDVEHAVYEVFEKVVETTGEFLWPKQRRSDGKTFGFDEKELARKKAKYLDVTQFYAQYYNNPNAVETALIDKSKFNYYDRSKVENISGAWYVGDRLLSVYAAMDFAYSVTNTSDYTVIGVVGVDEDSNYYILDIDRFKTNKISVMYDRAEAVFRKWRFKKMRCEAVAAQRLIVQQFKDYMRGQSIVFTVDEYFPPKTMNKAERIASILEPRYQNNQIYHYQGGNCQVLEEELLMNNPEHDDVKDCIAAAVEIAKPTIGNTRWGRKDNVVSFNSKFGGVAYR
jgi:phage terminase large subunit-like protein